MSTYQETTDESWRAIYFAKGVAKEIRDAPLDWLMEGSDKSVTPEQIAELVLEEIRKSNEKSIQ